MPSKLRFIMAVTFAGTFLGCRTTEFTTSSNKRPVSGFVQPIIVDCLQEEAQFHEMALKGNVKTELAVQGKVCPNMDDIFEKKTVLVIVDQSGSMQGNDPVIGNTCSRLEAIRALVNKIGTTEKALDNVKLGIIGFDSSSRVLLDPTSVNHVGGLLSANPICDASSYTNYESAFDTASGIATRFEGAKDIYFISDGLPRLPPELGIPSVRGGTPAHNGIAAANDLRTLGNVDLFVLYLKDTTDASESEVTDPVAYLNQVAGDSSKVKVVVEAKKLVDEILKFDVKPAPMIAVLNPVITLESPGYAPREIKLSKIEPDLATKGVWNYESEIFIPYSAPDTETENRVIIKMIDNNGRTFVSTVLVRFSYENYNP